MPSRDRLVAKPHRFVRTIEGREEPAAALRGCRGRRAMRFKRTWSGARRSEGRQAGAGARDGTVTRWIEGIVEMDRGDDRSAYGLSGHVAKAMAADGGSLRIRCLNRRARGRRGRNGHWVGAGRCKGGKIVKQRGDKCQCQPERQRPAPTAPACGSVHDCLRGAAGDFHRKPLRLDEISRLGDVFKAAQIVRQSICKPRADDLSPRSAFRPIHQRTTS